MKKLFANLKKRVALLTILCMMVTLVPSAVSAATVSDISGHWAQTTIQAWVDQGTIKGYPDGTFRPENNISRAEFTILVNGMFGYTKMAANTFTDVKADAWYANTIAIGIEAGYINGYPDGTFKPENPISREEVASIIMKINKLVANEAGANHFTDANTLVWSKGAVGACYLAGILKGYPDGSFKGKNYIKRGEAVVALDRSSKYIAPVVVVTPPAVDTGGGGGGTTVPVPTLAIVSIDPILYGTGVVTSPYAIDAAIATEDAIMVVHIGNIVDSRNYEVTMTIENESGTERASASASGSGSLINDFLNDKYLSLTDLDYGLGLLDDETSIPTSTDQVLLEDIYNSMIEDQRYEMTITITPSGYTSRAGTAVIYLEKLNVPD